MSAADVDINAPQATSYLHDESNIPLSLSSYRLSSCDHLNKSNNTTSTLTTLEDDLDDDLYLLGELELGDSMSSIFSSTNSSSHFCPKECRFGIEWLGEHHRPSITSLFTDLRPSTMPMFSMGPEQLAYYSGVVEKVCGDGEAKEQMQEEAEGPGEGVQVQEKVTEGPEEEKGQEVAQEQLQLQLQLQSKEETEAETQDDLDEEHQIDEITKEDAASQSLQQFREDFEAEAERLIEEDTKDESVIEQEIKQETKEHLEVESQIENILGASIGEIHQDDEEAEHESEKEAQSEEQQIENLQEETKLDIAEESFIVHVQSQTTTDEETLGREEEVEEEANIDGLFESSQETTERIEQDSEESLESSHEEIDQHSQEEPFHQLTPVTTPCSPLSIPISTLTTFGTMPENALGKDTTNYQKKVKTQQSPLLSHNKSPSKSQSITKKPSNTTINSIPSTRHPPSTHPSSTHIKSLLPSHHNHANFTKVLTNVKAAIHTVERSMTLHHHHHHNSNLSIKGVKVIKGIKSTLSLKSHNSDWSPERKHGSSLKRRFSGLKDKLHL